MDIMVSVVCTVFNHERYIRQCLDSLVSQKTDFKYEILIHDDASTDKSAVIIEEYAERYPDKIILVLQKENQYSQGINPTNILLERAKGKYIAICEGDDFWTSEEKLQRQVDFMEVNPEYSLCVHAAYYAHENGKIDTKSFFKAYETGKTVDTDEILKGWRFATNSILYRRDVRKSLDIPYRGKCENGDFALLVYLSLQGKVYYMPECMSAYRVSSVGSLNWRWKNDAEKYARARREFADMLRRIDSYTDHKYHETIAECIEKVELSAYYATGDLKSLKRNKKMYSSLTTVQKAKVWFQYYFPKTFRSVQSIMKR